jgi:hypothetical protein
MPPFYSEREKEAFKRLYNKIFKREKLLFYNKNEYIEYISEFNIIDCLISLTRILL